MNKNTRNQRQILTSILLALAMLCAAPSLAQDDPNLPEWERVKRTPYTVKVLEGRAWQPVEVQGALVTDYSIAGVREDTVGRLRTVMGFASFDTEARSIRVRITRQGAPFQSVTIRPTEFKVPYTRIDDRTIELTLRGVDKRVSVEFDGDRRHNLFLIPNRPVSSKAQRRNSAHMRYYGPGEHMAGQIVMQEGDTLFIDNGATVYGSINAHGVDNIVLMGHGTLCGSRNVHDINRRQPILYMQGCRNVQIEGIMFRGSPSWTMHMAQCENVVFDNIKNICWMRNSDGFDLCNCRHVRIANCLLRNFDDNLSIKNFAARPIGSKNDNSIVNFTRKDFTTEGTGGKEHTEDILMENCVLWADCAHNILVGPESRGDLHMNNIRFRNIQILEGLEHCVPYTGALAIMAADEGTFTNISFENIAIDHVTAAQPISLDYCTYVSRGKKVDNVSFRNIRVLGTKSLPKSQIMGRDADHPMRNILLKGITVNGTRVTPANFSDWFNTNEFIKNLTVK